jgi:cytochrome oxidase Cu insertion factor (SCO1/SenC/PrrC family)
MTNARRRRFALTIAIALLPLAACGSGSGSPKAVPAPSQNLGAVVNFAIPPAIASLPLTKPDGSTTTLAAYRGEPVMIADFLTNCTDICPLISANTAALGRAIAADGYGGKVALLEISVDPHRDTAARLLAYRKLFGAPLADWTLLRTSPADTAKLWKYLGVEYQRVKEGKPPAIDWLTHKPLTYDVVHSDDLIFLDAAGHERFVVNADPDVQGKLPPAKLVRFLDGQGLKSLYHPNRVASWTVAQGLSIFSWLMDRHLPLPS